MTRDESCLAANALALRRFTARDLAQASGINLNSVRSWLNRRRDLFEVSNDSQQAKGRPRNIFVLKSGAPETLQDSLDEFSRIVSIGSSDAGQTALLHGIEEKLHLWKMVSNSEIDARGSDQEYGALRAAVRLGWEQLAEWNDGGAAVGDERLRHFAEIEFAASIAAIPTADRIPALSRWLSGRLEAITRRTISAGFAAKVMGARCAVRPRVDFARAIAAALAAPVGSDEGWADDEVSPSALFACRAIAEQFGMAERLSLVSTTIDEVGTSRAVPDEEAQAIARGLTSCYDASRSNDLHLWLASGHIRVSWRPVLAPVAVHSLLDAANFNLHEVVRQFRPSLDIALEMKCAAGRLRQEALEKSRDAMRVVPDAGAPLSGAEALLASAQSFTFRPMAHVVA